MLIPVAGKEHEPETPASQVLDLAQSRNKDIANNPRIAQSSGRFQSIHSLLYPSRAPMARGDVFPCNSASSTSLFLTEGRRRGYRGVKAIGRFLLSASP